MLRRSDERARIRQDGLLSRSPLLAIATARDERAAVSRRLWTARLARTPVARPQGARTAHPQRRRAAVDRPAALVLLPLDVCVGAALQNAACQPQGPDAEQPELTASDRGDHEPDHRCDSCPDADSARHCTGRAKEGVERSEHAGARTGRGRGRGARCGARRRVRLKPHRPRHESERRAWRPSQHVHVVG